MDTTVFFSWQSDTRLDLGKTFILEALAMAKSVDEVVPAERLDVDEGLKDVPGSPEIARIIFEKIDQAFLFVGDVTLVGQLPDGGKLLAKGQCAREVDAKRRTPNPNVMMELGYADGMLGVDRVIRVMNTAFGKPEDQPFDVRNRRFPIRFRATPEMTPSEIEVEKNKLSSTLKEAIATASAFQLRRAMNARGRLDVHSVEMMVIYGRNPWEFPQPSKADPQSGVAWLCDLDLFHRCTMRLLDLGIIRTNLGNVSGSLRYTYIWTPFGRKVRELIPLSQQ
jgi:hypothetical protein